MKSNAEVLAVPVERTRAIDYVALAKPRLNFLVVVSALAGYVMAGGDTTRVLLLLATVAGTGLVAGGASALNQIIERQPDALRPRHEQQPGLGIFAVAAVARRRAGRRRHETDALVVAHGRCGDPRPFGQLLDLHGRIVNLEPGCKVKGFAQVGTDFFAGEPAYGRTLSSGR